MSTNSERANVNLGEAAEYAALAIAQMAVAITASHWDKRVRQRAVASLERIRLSIQANAVIREGGVSDDQR